jgi:glyoxylase-like metal-dependent hydrolase (beta-lactamase superfamily II)
VVRRATLAGAPMAGLLLDRDFDPHYGRSVPVAPGVRRVTAPNAGPFTFAGTNSYIVGSGRVAVIDPGPADESHFQALMSATTGETITHICVSHAHRDHCGGAARLVAATGARTYGFGRARRTADGASAVDDETTADFAPDAPLADGAPIAGDGWQMQAIATPGHSSDHLAFALAGSDLLFSGDHVMAWSTTVVAAPQGSMADYVASLDRLLQRAEDTYLPGHGGPVTKAHDHVRTLKAHRRARAAAILAFLKDGPAPIPTIVAAVYRDLDPRLAGGAGLTVLAHLEELTAQGEVAADGSPGATSTFRLMRPR